MERDRNNIDSVNPMNTRNTLADSDDMQRIGRDNSTEYSDNNDSVGKETNTNWDENQSENANWDHEEKNDVERTTDNTQHEVSDRSTSKIIQNRQRATEKRMNKESSGMTNYSDEARSFPIG